MSLGKGLVGRRTKYPVASCRPPRRDDANLSRHCSGQRPDHPWHAANAPVAFASSHCRGAEAPQATTAKARRSFATPQMSRASARGQGAGCAAPIMMLRRPDRSAAGRPARAGVLRSSRPRPGPVPAGASRGCPHAAILPCECGHTRLRVGVRWRIRLEFQVIALGFSRLVACD